MNWLITSNKTIGAVVILWTIFFIAFFLRVQDISTIPRGQFTSNDAYLYYRQAQLVSEHGHLPTRDMHRWLPLGRDLSQTLNLYPYVLAYTHKAVAAVFPDFTLYQIIIYAPVACFCVGLGVLYVFLYYTFGQFISGITSLLLATLPGTINRSVAGFSDRDSWCLMLGILTITTYLISLQTQPPRRRLLWTLASGFIMFLGGISWEGFGVFLGIILVVEFWRFLTSETEEGLGLYVLWVLTFVPALYLASATYRNGYGFAKHLFAFMLMPPIILLGLRVLRHLLMLKVNKLRSHARTFALGLTFTSATIALGYVFTQLDSFGSTTVPFSQSQLMQSVDELKPPTYNYWVVLYGNTFSLASFGLIIAIMLHWKKVGSAFIIPLVLFMLTTFFREFFDNLWGISLSNILFFTVLIYIPIVWIWSAWRINFHPKNEHAFIAFAAWFLFWVALARDANRYEFFTGISIAFFTAVLIQILCNTISNKLTQSPIRQRLLITGGAVTILTLLMFWNPTGAYIKRSIFATRHIRQSIPTDSSLTKTYQWIKAELPRTTVIAADWGYGNQLNVLAGVKTITDPDHYIPHWIDLYNPHVCFALSEREVLEFLKIHAATHLLLTEKEPENTFLRGQLSDAFVPVYPTDNFENALVKVWEIHYPPDIKLNPKYLATKPEK